MTTTQQLPLFSRLEDQDEEGRFPCPMCDTIIDPDDVSGESYVVIDSILNGKRELTKVIVRCTVCMSEIHVLLTEPHKRSLFDRTFDFVGGILARYRYKTKKDRGDK
jgi:hypothetical protein